jgi:hypothetical protein
MEFKSIRRLVGIVILLVSLALLIWGIWDFPGMVRTLELTPGDMQLPTPESFAPLKIWV